MKVRSRHNVKQRRKIRFVLAALFVVVLGMFLPRLASWTAMIIMTPIHAVNVWLEESSSLVPTFFRDRRDLLAQITNLEQRLTISERTTLTQNRLSEENNRLRRLLGIDSEERIAAAIIARPNQLPYDLLQIDRGSDHGVEIGSPVFIGKDVVIGLVVHTAPTYSFVALVTTPGFSATAFIAGPNVIATMEGVGGGVARVHVPQGVPLAVGDLVYLPSVEPGVYGRISHVENQPTQPEQYGYISPDIALSGLYHVAVGKQSQIARSADEIEERVRASIVQSLLNKEVSLGIATTSIATSTGSTATP